MSLIKEVDLYIKGSQMSEEIDKPEITEVRTKGKYHQKDGVHYVTYDEIHEGISEPVKVLIKLHDRGIVVTKKGHVNMVMTYDREEVQTVKMMMPFGEMEIKVDTKAYGFSEANEGEEKKTIQANARYELDFGGGYVTDNSIEITICQ